MYYVVLDKTENSDMLNKNTLGVRKVRGQSETAIMQLYVHMEQRGSISG